MTNSFTYLTNGNRMAEKVGPTGAKLIFSFLMILYFLVCASLCFLFYSFWILNTLWIVFLVTWVAKNGAQFYMDYFSKRYESNLALLDSMTEELGADD